MVTTVHGLQPVVKIGAQPVSSVHGWQSKRWVLGVCGTVMREGWIGDGWQSVMREGWINDGWQSIMRERHGPDGSAVDLKFR